MAKHEPTAAEIFARRLLARGVVILTGAGMSTASGIADYRSAETGLWTKVDPKKMATPQAMRANYSEFQTFYTMRIREIARTRPNVGHELVAEWEKLGYVKGVITQNVDGLHSKAGSVNVAEIHGALESIYCMSCGRSAEVSQFTDKEECSSCGGKLRPWIVLFGEDMHAQAMSAAKQLMQRCTMFVVMGSSLRVFPAADMPQEAKKAGAFVIIVNNEPTERDRYADLLVREPICDFLAAVQKELVELRKPKT
jgi:NAD-dependent deacetylase